MRWVLIIVGVVLVLAGLVWVLQGANVLAGSVMSGHRRWIVIGAGLDVIGVVLIVLGARMKRVAA